MYFCVLWNNYFKALMAYECIYICTHNPKLILILSGV